MNSMIKIVVSFAVGAGLLLSIAACGQKGSLMLPSPAAPQAVSSAASAPR